MVIQIYIYKFMCVCIDRSTDKCKNKLNKSDKTNWNIFFRLSIFWLFTTSFRTEVIFRKKVFLNFFKKTFQYSYGKSWSTIEVMKNEVVMKHIYHHHHIMPLARISLTLSHHPSLSIIHRFQQVFQATSCIRTELL